MHQIVVFCFFLNAVSGHSKVQTLQNEGDMQSSLMPQELNPEFMPDKISLPIPRLRRYTQVLYDEPTTVANQLKKYTRIASCVVLITSAIVEIVLYAIDYYNNL